MKKRYFLLSFLFLVSCNKTNFERVNYTAIGEFINDELYLPMNTINTITLYESEKLNELKDDYNDSLLHYSKLIDRNKEFENINNVYTINSNCGNDEFISIDKDLFDLIKFSIEYTKFSEGKFNLLMGNLIDLYQPILDRSRNTILSNEEILEGLNKTPKYYEIEDYIILNEEDYSIKLNKYNGYNISISLGGIGKGFITDKIYEKYKNYNYPMVISSGSSTIAILGNNPMKKDGKYSVGFRNVSLQNYSDTDLFRVGNSNIVSINVNGDYFISSSGDDENYRYLDNKLITHIIDPNTGLNNDVFRSISIGSKLANNTLLDATSTALFNCYSVDEAKEFIEKIEDEYQVDFDYMLVKPVDSMYERYLNYNVYINESFNNLTNNDFSNYCLNKYII